MIDFLPHPKIAPCESKFDPAIHDTHYKYNYEAIFRDIAQGKVDQRAAFRSIIRDDLFFVAYFVMENPLVNKPFGVKMCRMVEEGPQTKTLDVWARGHLKSFLLTQAETIKRIVTNPEETHVIFSYKKPKAEDFLSAIKRTLEKPLMTQCFPDILYESPERESPSWSIQNGIMVKRKSVSRKEKTVETYGIIEGMPTGGHWDRRIYDDIETADLAKNPEQLQNLIQMFDYSKNLGSPGGIERIIGTYYSHCGLLVHLKDKKNIHGDYMYQTRIVPATDNGKADGKPVFLSQEDLDDFKLDKTFNSQQLCNPTPDSEIKLNFNYLNPIEPKFIPQGLVKLMMVDQAGDNDINVTSGDMWSFGVIGVKPRFEDLQGSDIYILDLECGQFGHAQAINSIVQMYLRQGLIMQLGVEKVALSTTEIHIAEALKTRGRYLSKDSRNLVDLKPAGRDKNRRIEGALQLPLCNGKIFYSTEIPIAFIEKLKEEMDKFPFYHVDILDMLAYGYDMIRDCPFLRYAADDDEEEDHGNVVDIRGRSRIGGY